MFKWGVTPNSELLHLMHLHTLLFVCSTFNLKGTCCVLTMRILLNKSLFLLRLRRCDARRLSTRGVSRNGDCLQKLLTSGNKWDFSHRLFKKKAHSGCWKTCWNKKNLTWKKMSYTPCKLWVSCHSCATTWRCSGIKYSPSVSEYAHLFHFFVIFSPSSNRPIVALCGQSEKLKAL